MVKLCESCGKSKETYMKTAEFQNGQRGEVYLCEECFAKFEQSKDWFMTTKGYVKNSQVNDKNQINSTTGWTDFAKIINIIVLIISFVLGSFIGTISGNALSYEDGAGVIGAIIGGITGFLIGGVIVSFSMVIVEISQKLSAILGELKKK